MRGNNLIGQKYSGFTVVAPADSHGGHKYWKCICDCGREKVVRGSHLVIGNVKPCECTSSNRGHGSRTSRLYAIWNNMKQRCNNPKNAGYPDYGDRGITVCEEWNSSFETFRDWALANGYQDHLTLDRKDNDGSYNPKNCWWATPKEQANNTRRNKTYLYNGGEMTVPELSSISGISQGTIRARIANGWSIKEAMEPVRKESARKKKVDIEQLKCMKQNGITVKEICKKAGISAPTYYRIMEEFKNEP